MSGIMAGRRLAAAKLRRDEILEWLGHLVAEGEPPPPPAKSFKPSNEELPILDSYEEDPGEAYWKFFVKNSEAGLDPAFPMEADKLVEMCDEVGWRDRAAVMQVANDLKHGADIGVEEVGGRKYRHSINKNNKVVETPEWGPAVMDAVCSWAKKGIILGPMKRVPENVTVIKVTCRSKAGGKARVIMDQSSPRGTSQNDHIDKKKFPVIMSGMEGVLDMVNFVGRYGWLAKSDWRDAYKHWPVARRCRQYQSFVLMGRAFVEKHCTFGCRSSPGIFCRGAKLPIMVSCRRLNFPARQCNMHLDDLVMCGRGEEEK